MSSRASRIPLIVSCWVFTLAAPAANAQTSIAPPGKSGADQYFETLPTARGNVAPPPSSGGAIGVGAAAGERRLARLGKDGQAAATLAAATAAVKPKAKSVGVAKSRQPGSASTSVGSLITGSDSGGIGVWLPILLALSLVAAIAFLLGRRRRPHAS